MKKVKNYTKYQYLFLGIAVLYFSVHVIVAIIRSLI